MAQDSLDNLLIFDKADDPHGTLALWANERIKVI
jgi:hypothetical protein